jgi:DNA-binding response OmpR family regulator
MKLKIMVIDDDPVILETVHLNLARRGYDTVSFTNGDEALNKVSSLHPDLIILDVIMPQMDGWEVLKIIKDHYPEEDLKVLLLTAKSTDKDKMIGTSILKADGYITKPFDLQDLLQKVKSLLGE